MSFVALTNAGGSLTVDVPPKVLNRAAEGAPDRSVAVSLAGTPIVTEWVGAQLAQRLVLRWEVLSGAQVATLLAILQTTGTVTVRLYTGGSTILCAWAPRDEQKITPLLGDYPERLASGATQLTTRTQCSAELTLIRI